MSRAFEYRRRIEALEAQRFYARLRDPGPEASDYERTLYAIVSNARRNDKTVTLEWAQDRTCAILAAIRAIDELEEEYHDQGTA